MQQQQEGFAQEEKESIFRDKIRNFLLCNWKRLAEGQDKKKPRVVMKALGKKERYAMKYSNEVLFDLELITIDNKFYEVLLNIVKTPV